MGELNDFLKKLQTLLKEDQRFKEEAYFFVMASLGRALKALDNPRHVSGLELLKAVREEAEEQFGPMAGAVFHHWGVKNSLDFGMIVFNMVREGILSKTDEDRLEDFKDSVFFENLFDQDSGYPLGSDQGFVKTSKK